MIKSDIAQRDDPSTLGTIFLLLIKFTMLESDYQLLGIFIFINFIVLLISIAKQIKILGIKEGLLTGLLIGITLMIIFSLFIGFILGVIYIGVYLGDVINPIS